MIYKQRSIWMIKLKHHGKVIRKSAHTGDAELARMRGEEARQSLCASTGIPAFLFTPTLEEFISHDFLKFVKNSYTIRPATRTYYGSGTKYLKGSHIAKLTLDKITSRDVMQFASEFLSRHGPSTLNCALRTLRRILSLAKEWHIVDAVPRIQLSKKERIRDRVLTPEEQRAYLKHCCQPWRDCATIILGTGMRPGEVFALRWENVALSESSGLIYISEGKTPAARRVLPMLPEVLEIFRRRAAKKESEVWVFPAPSKSGHKNGNGSRKHHLYAVRDSKVKPFPPYTLRHTALTRLAVAGVPAHTLAVIAGHTTVSMTSRYIHPHLEAILRAFEKVGLPKQPDENPPVHLTENEP